MNIIKFFCFILAILIGIFLIIYGEIDDSPGGQVIGLLAVIVGIVGVIKRRNKSPDLNNFLFNFEWCVSEIGTASKNVRTSFKKHCQFKKTIMKIIKEDSGLMIIKDRNIIAYIIGLIFVVAGFIAVFKPNFFIDHPPAWSGLLGILIGGFVIFVAKITTIIFDKASNKLLFSQKGLISKGTKEYILDQIKEVELSMAYSTSNKSRGYSYHLACVLKNGELVQLNPWSSSNTRVLGSQVIPEKNIGERIANFLRVPFLERRPPTVVESLSAVSGAIQRTTEKEVKK